MVLLGNLVGSNFSDRGIGSKILDHILRATGARAQTVVGSRPRKQMKTNVHSNCFFCQLSYLVIADVCVAAAHSCVG